MKEEHIGVCYVLKETKVELLDQLCRVKDRRQQTVRERGKQLFELLNFLLPKEMPKVISSKGRMAGFIP